MEFVGHFSKGLVPPYTLVIWRVKGSKNLDGGFGV
jgi:hypothetical protein